MYRYRACAAPMLSSFARKSSTDWKYSSLAAGAVNLACMYFSATVYNIYILGQSLWLATHNQVQLQICQSRQPSRNTSWYSPHCFALMNSYPQPLDSTWWREWINYLVHISLQFSSEFWLRCRHDCLTRTRRSTSRVVWCTLKRCMRTCCVYTLLHIGRLHIIVCCLSAFELLVTLHTL